MKRRYQVCVTFKEESYQAEYDTLREANEASEQALQIGATQVTILENEYGSTRRYSSYEKH